MSEYLTKEEIRKWRSSLERITLEEYAARLGKIIQEEKHDDSLIDTVMLKSLNSMTQEVYTQKAEKIQSLTVRPHAKTEIKPMTEFKKEIEIKEENTKELEDSNKVEVNNEQKQIEVKEKLEETSFDFSFKKALTAREQLVFDHFLENKNKIVYAKDLALILELPRDYVYKYIKNLRSKLNENVLINADNGGYMLKV